MSAPTDWILTSERLGWRCWTAADLPLARTLWGNPEVMALLHVDGVLGEGAVRERLELEIALQAEHGFSYWPVFELSDGGFVGCCGLRPKGPEPDRREHGFHLVPSAWGRGLASEASARVIRHAFEDLGVKTLCALHHPENRSSQRVLAKMGFIYDQLEFYAPTQLEHPSYLLFPPGEEGSV